MNPLPGMLGRIEAVFFCPHAPEEECDCRKPAPGLFLQICSRFGVPPEQVLAAGDSVRDAQQRAYAAVSQISWDGEFHRSDIGWRAIARDRF